MVSGPALYEKGLLFLGVPLQFETTNPKPPIFPALPYSQERVSSPGRAKEAMPGDDENLPNEVVNASVTTFNKASLGWRYL